MELTLTDLIVWSLALFFGGAAAGMTFMSKHSIYNQMRAHNAEAQLNRVRLELANIRNDHLKDYQ